MKQILIVGIIVSLLLTACQSQSDITAQAVAEQPIKIGVNFPMTGGLSIYGEPLFEGLSLGVEEINAAGGVNGKQIQLILEDNGGDPKKAVSAAQKLLDTDQVHMMITTMVGPTGAIAPITEAKKKVLIYAAATDKFAEKNKYVFKDSVDAKYDCEILAAEALKSNMNKIALLGAIAEFTEDCKKSIQEGIFKTGKGEILSYETYEHGETDFKTKLTKIKAKNPDVVFLSAYSDDCLQIWKQAKELDVNIPYMLPFTQTGCGEEKAISIAGGINVSIIGLDFVVDKTKPEYKQFITGFKQKYNKNPSLPFFTTLAYDWAHYIAKALEQCPDPEDSECLKTKLEQTDYKGALGQLTYKPTHATFRERIPIMYKDGVWVVM